MIIDFKDRVAIVTGGGHGLGRAIAHALVARGSRVWACDINREPLAETKANAAPAEGGSIDCAMVDVADRDHVGKFVEAIVASTGRIDVLVCSAGGVRGQVHQPVETVTQAQFQEIFDANVKGVFNFAQAVVPHMKRAQHGRIVVISSGAGLGISLTGIQAYAAAKAAAIGLTRQLAHELGPFGITVNSVAPGFIRSNPSSEKQWQSYGEAGQKALIERIAMRRLGTPADIAYATLFLASAYAGWITGQVLSVDGGK
jgi:3-oxoacyl-[acyl-carrier protein] reductase